MLYEQSVKERQNTVYAWTQARWLPVPSMKTPPHLEARPISTKYSLFLTCNKSDPNPNSTNTSPALPNTDVESDLRNQIYALQSCPQAVYVPSSHSSLYENKFQSKAVSASREQPFPQLFATPQFSQTIANENVGYALFNNPTRIQFRDA